MGRKITKNWKLEGFKSIKVKLYKPTFERFKMYCNSKQIDGRKMTMQDFLENKINEEINK